MIKSRLRTFRTSIVVSLLFLAAMSAWAVDARRGLSQYVHDSWGADKGFMGGTIFAITKSRDGYLWLGTEHGLVRFDGFEFTAVPAPLPDGRHAGAVRGFVEDADGELWVRLDGPRLLRYENGAFDDPVAKFGLSDAAFTAMSQDTRGELLLWGPRSGTLRFQNGRFDRISACAGINGIVISILDSTDGTLWLGARDAGLYRIQNGKCNQILSEVRLQSVNALARIRRWGRVDRLRSRVVSLGTWRIGPSRSSRTIAQGTGFRAHQGSSPQPMGWYGPRPFPN